MRRGLKEKSIPSLRCQRMRVKLKVISLQTHQQVERPDGAATTSRASSRGRPRSVKSTSGRPRSVSSSRSSRPTPTHATTRAIESSIQCDSPSKPNIYCNNAIKSNSSCT